MTKFDTKKAREWSQQEPCLHSAEDECDCGPVEAPLLRAACDEIDQLREELEKVRVERDEAKLDAIRDVAMVTAQARLSVDEGFEASNRKVSELASLRAQLAKRDECIEVLLSEALKAIDAVSRGERILWGNRGPSKRCASPGCPTFVAYLDGPLCSKHHPAADELKKGE